MESAGLNHLELGFSVTCRPKKKNPDRYRYYHSDFTVEKIDTKNLNDLLIITQG